jgi:hypothetical protein
VIDTSALGTAVLGDSVHASLKGFWGFDPYEGPTFRLINVHAKSWELAAGDEAALIVGRQDTVHLQADSVSCVDAIMLKDPAGKELKVDWKSVKPNEVEVKLPLQESKPGALTLLVTQYGLTEPQPVSLHTFAEAGRYDSFSMHAGESQGTLKGSRLDEVASLTVRGVTFAPGELLSRGGSDELPMVAQDPQAASALKAERGVAAKVSLLDGRSLPVTASVDAPRPRVALIGKSVQASAATNDSNIQLADAGQLPQDASLVFSIRALSPASFARDGNVDVATGDETSATSLSVANGGLTLETAQVAVATLNPVRAFGPSTFGPLKFRVNTKGMASEWQPLANLVRLPALKELKCPPTPELVACKLVGINLFLLDIAGDAEFTHPVTVPEGFLGTALPVPHPTAGPLYVKLRDNPQVVNPTLLIVQQLAVPADDAGRSEARHSAVRSDAPGAPAAAPSTSPP